MNVELIKISQKGQVVIPNSLRTEMNIKKSDKFIIFGKDDTIILKKIEKDAFIKRFDEIAIPLQKSVLKLGISKSDLKNEIRAVRNNG